MALSASPTSAPEPEGDVPVGPAQPAPSYGRARLAAALAAIVLMSELAPMELTLVYPSLRYMTADFHTPHIA
ncbi:hypothetical protein [Embleya sp. NBC_00896]|uniref:hypothetical protein n=1 Tax=Embleya sp. NBC_00896 TaxID=2975961 RepID=UPI002F913545|nr:hypothetical protein OG928_34785 [Embleya sp. NBC_00896]